MFLQGLKKQVIARLVELTDHNCIEITRRGNAAIAAALSILPLNKKVIIPEEGGWLSYRTLPLKLGLQTAEVKCNASKINLSDLNSLLAKGNCAAFIYQNPGGYFAEQPMAEIYNLCKEKGCLVILDVSGSIGTKYCNGNYADILVGSFGEWKLVEAKVGGFVSANDEEIFRQIQKNAELLDERNDFKTILQKLEALPERINFLNKRRQQVILDLLPCDIVHEDDFGLVVVIKYPSEKDKAEKIKESVIKYCRQNFLEWTECPRYIRLNQPGISVEIKRLDKTKKIQTRGGEE